MGDASYRAGEKAIGGQFVFLGDDGANHVMSLYGKSKLIRKVCKSPKDAETINMGILADVSRYTANQVEQLLSGSISKTDEKDTKVDIKLFSDSLGTLESIASSHQVDRRMMRSDISDLKQKLEDGEIKRYSWLQDEHMLADILTKEKKVKHGLDDVLKENKLNVLKSEDNCVEYVDGEIEIRGRILREKLTPKNKIPMRKQMRKMNHSPSNKKEEGEESKRNVTIPFNT